MSYRIVLVSVLLLAATPMANDVHAQGNGPICPLKVAEPGLAVGSPHPDLLKDAKVDGYEYLEASLSVEDKAAAVSWAPFLTSTHYSFWSESRIQVRQEDDVTSVGVALKFNPLNPRSKRGERVWNSFEFKSADDSALLDAKKARAARLSEEAFRELTGHCVPDDVPNLPRLKRLKSTLENDQHRREPPSGPFLDDLRCELVNARNAIQKLEQRVGSATDDDDLKTLKAQLKEWQGAFDLVLKAVERGYVSEHLGDTTMTPLVSMRAEIAALTQEVAEAETAWAGETYSAYRTELMRASVLPVITVSHVSSFFKILGGDEVDTDEDGLNDHEHRMTKRSLSLAADWRLGEHHALSLLLSRSMERPEAEEGTSSANFNSFGMTWLHRLMVLDRDGYRKTKAYLEGLYVPAINFGLAYELKDCDSSEGDCAKGVLRAQSLTPFVDFKLNPKAQFRIGVPLQRSRLFSAETQEQDEDTIEIVTLIAFQLGEPK